jgi:hypothetical protein
MDLLLAGLAGVVLGAGVTLAIFLYVLQRRADRDLVERRLRACCEYEERLGGISEAIETGSDDPAVLEQAWHGVSLFCREFRLTGWLFTPQVRESLQSMVEDLEKEARAFRSGGALSGGRAAHVLCEKHHELSAILRRELQRAEGELRAFRFFPGRSKEEL